LKSEQLERRSRIKRKAEQEYAAAIKEADYATAFSKAVMTGRITAEVEADSKRLLDLLGIPWVQAPSEGEAQAAYMSQKGDVWGVNSRDYDSLLFGAPRLVRYLTIHGEKWLPSKGKTRRLKPEIIELNAFLMHNGINREQLVDLAIMIGTDFNQGIKGIGPKTALKLIKKHGRLECMPDEVVDKLPDNFKEICRIFHEPSVTDDYSISWGTPRGEELISFLCEERSFSKERVELISERMKRFHQQKSLKDWTRGST
jgi:flap endonuclease-1